MTNRKNAIESILKNFTDLKHRIMTENQHLWSRCNLTPAQGRILFLVKKDKNLGITEIAQKTNVTNSAATQLVNSLVESGFLIRKNDDTDHRVVRVELSQKTCGEIDEMKSRSLSKLATVFAALDNEELFHLEKIMQKITTKKEE